VKRTRIKPISDKQKKKLQEWAIIKEGRCVELYQKYGYVPCEYCKGEVNFIKDSLWCADPHHIDKDRNNNTMENCYICHRICHSKITDNNIKVQREDFQGGTR